MEGAVTQQEGGEKYTLVPMKVPPLVHRAAIRLWSAWWRSFRSALESTGVGRRLASGGVGPAAICFAESRSNHCSDFKLETESHGQTRSKSLETGGPGPRPSLPL